MKLINTRLIKRLLALVAALSLGVTQMRLVSPQEAASEEGREVRAVYATQGNSITPAQFLDYIYQCTRPVHAYILLGNKLHLRVYEFDTISETIYRLQGASAVSNAIRRAEVKARGSAVKAIMGTQVYLQETVGDININVTRAQEAQTSGGERAAIAQISSDQVNFFMSVTESSAQGFIRGAVVSGTKIISLGNGGICVMIRMDVPLDQGSGGSGGNTGTQGGSGGSGAPFNPGGAPPLPPGSKGDW